MSADSQAKARDDIHAEGSGENETIRRRATKEKAMTHITTPEPALTAEAFEAATAGRKFHGRAYAGARLVLVDGVSVRQAAQVNGVSNTAVQRIVTEIVRASAARSRQAEPGDSPTSSPSSRGDG
jgi:hypothetical protein